MQISNRYTVLVVDDYEDLRKYLVLSIRKMGFSALSAQNGDVALQIINDGTVDVVICDIEMPGITGFDLLAKMRSQGHQTPVIMMTGSTKYTADFVRTHGGEDLLLKPILDDVLLNAIYTALKISPKQ